MTVDPTATRWCWTGCGRRVWHYDIGLCAVCARGPAHDRDHMEAKAREVLGDDLADRLITRWGKR